jgi:anaerobic selenocysteine-containing dehydrogenase
MTTVSYKNQWQPTACGLCYINCGIEAMTEGPQIVKVRGDRAHPSTRGYACQKAQRLNYYQNHADRLTTPLRKGSDGSFEAIDWDTAIREIASVDLRRAFRPLPVTIRYGKWSSHRLV